MEHGIEHNMGYRSVTVTIDTRLTGEGCYTYVSSIKCPSTFFISLSMYQVFSLLEKKRGDMGSLMASPVVCKQHHTRDFVVGEVASWASFSIG